MRDTWTLTGHRYRWFRTGRPLPHYTDVIMTTMVSQITSLTVVYSIVHLGANQRKHRNSASLTFVRGIHRGPVNSSHKWPVTRKMFPFDDVIMPRCDMAFIAPVHRNKPDITYLLATVLSSGTSPEMGQSYYWYEYSSACEISLVNVVKWNTWIYWYFLTVITSFKWHF